MLKYKDFLNENNKEFWIHEGDFIVTKDMVENGRFIEGKIPDFINGYFDCSDNKLTSLVGGPENVTGHFKCNHNNLISLEGCPNIIGEYFKCSCNKLTSLEGGPKEIGGNFVCSFNKIINLKGSPNIINGNFICSNNMLTSLEGVTKNFNRTLYIHKNLLDLEIEAVFIESGSFKGDYYLDLLNYCIINKIDLEEVKSWPENFLTDNIKSSVKGINKFKL